MHPENELVLEAASSASSKLLNSSKNSKDSTSKSSNLSNSSNTSEDDAYKSSNSSNLSSTSEKHVEGDSVNAALDNDSSCDALVQNNAPLEVVHFPKYDPESSSSIFSQYSTNSLHATTSKS